MVRRRGKGARALVLLAVAVPLTRQTFAVALPRWLVVLTYVVGIAEFVNVTVARPTIYVFPAWIALVSVTLLVRRSPGRSDAPGRGFTTT